MYTNWNFPSGTNRSEFWIGQRYTDGTSTPTDGHWRMVTQHDLPVVGSNGCELNKWFKVERVITIPEQAHSSIGSASSIQFYNTNADVSASVTFRMRNVKIEYGNKATDWTPAPEDVQNQIDENKNEVNTRMSEVEQTVDSWGVKITENENDIASLKLTDEQFEVKMSQNINDIASLKLTNEQFEVKIGNKVDRSNIISTINASTENITISSSKVNISGFVTFSDLSTYGTTTINGSNITTGTINGNKANITNINASNITTGTLNANYIDVINLNASNIVTGTLSGNYIRGGTIEGTLLRTTALTTYGGVSIEQNSMQIGSTAFHYRDSRFKIEANANFSLSSMNDIYIMAGLNQDGTVGGKGKVYIYTDLVVEGKISSSGGGITATFG